MIMNPTPLLLVEKEKRVGELLLHVFSELFEVRKIGVFKNCENADQTLKNTFLYLLWDWVRLYIGDSSLSLLDFMDWFGSPYDVSTIFCIYSSESFGFFICIVYTFYF